MNIRRPYLVLYWATKEARIFQDKKNPTRLWIEARWGNDTILRIHADGSHRPRDFDGVNITHASGSTRNRIIRHRKERSNSSKNYNIADDLYINLKVPGLRLYSYNMYHGSTNSRSHIRGLELSSMTDPRVRQKQLQALQHVVYS